MDLLDNIKKLPADLINAIKRVSDAGEAEVTVEKTYVAGLTITIKTGDDAEDLDLDGMSTEELQYLLEDLERKLAILQGDEPEDDDSDEHEEWEDEVEALEEQIEEVQSALDDLED